MLDCFLLLLRRHSHRSLRGRRRFHEAYLDWNGSGDVAVCNWRIGCRSGGEVLRQGPPMVDPAFNWSGFYVGGNVGYSWGRERDDGTLTGTQSVQVFRTAGPTPVGGPVVTPLAAQTIW